MYFISNDFVLLLLVFVDFITFWKRILFLFKNKHKRKIKFLWKDKSSIVSCQFSCVSFKIWFCSEIPPENKIFAGKRAASNAVPRKDDILLTARKFNIKQAASRV